MSTGNVFTRLLSSVGWLLFLIPVCGVLVVLLYVFVGATGLKIAALLVLGLFWLVYWRSRRSA